MSEPSIEKTNRSNEPRTKECSNSNPEVLTAQDSFEQITGRRRTVEALSVEGIERNSGCSTEKWVLFAVKELVDNSLDKLGTRKIEVRLWKDTATQYVQVLDDGESEFSEESIKLLLDFELAPSSKRALHSSQLQRGILGNGVQTCLAISYALWDEEKRPENTAEIWNSNQCFKISLKVENNDVSTGFIEEPLEKTGNYTTAVLLKLPLSKYDSPLSVFRNIAHLNPDINFNYSDWNLSFSIASRATSSMLKTQKDYGSPFWYNWREFQALVTEKKDYPAGNFVTGFIGLKNRQYSGKVLKKAGILPGTRLQELSSEKLKNLFEMMKKTARPAKATILPMIGEKGLFSSDQVNIEESEASYIITRGNYFDGEKTIPFVIEVAAYPNFKEEIIEGINFTANFHTPFTRYVYGEKKETLREIIRGKRKSVVIHLVCPNITWLTPSKGELEVGSFQDLLLKAVKQAVKQKGEAALSKEELIAWSREVMEKYPSLTFTVRQVFYRLVSLKGYMNSRQRYNDLGKALTFGRDSGTIDPERIVDLSRPEYINNPTFHNPQDYVEAKLQAFFEEYDLDRWETQPYFVEVWIEKEALSRVLLPICRKYRVNLIVGKGYNSWTQVYKAVNHRFPKDGKQMFIIYLGDHDPPGLHIEEKLEEKIRSQAANKRIPLNLKVRRIALTYEQVKKYSLPPSALKKHPGAKWKKYVNLYGPNVWELDALDPEILTDLLETKISELIEPTAWAAKEEEVDAYREVLQDKAKEILCVVEGG